MNEPIETNVAGLEMMARMLEAIQTMREKIREAQNAKDCTWNDWDYSYTVDRLLSEAGVDCEDDS